jgi:hypothetical protein
MTLKNDRGAFLHTLSMRLANENTVHHIPCDETRAHPMFHSM